MNAEAQLTLEVVVSTMLLVASIAALIFAGSGKAVLHAASAIVAAAVVAVGVLRWLLPGTVWPLLAYTRSNDDGSVLFFDSRWFFLLPLAIGAFAALRWFHCHSIQKTAQPAAGGNAG